MVTFHSHHRHTDGVTLVRAALTDVTEPTRVVLANRLEGPLWPPRREGIPEDGWTASGFEAVLEPGRHALGYASPAQPADPAVELVEATPVPDAEPTRESQQSAAAVTRELGDPSPPRDALPAVGPGSETAAQAPSADDESGSRSELPDAVSPFFEAAHARVVRAEALAAAESVDEATEAVRDVGGLAGVCSLDDRQRDDERALRAIARRAEALADRRAAATIPTETLERLA